MIRVITRSVLVFLIVSSCFIGFYFEIPSAVSFYRLIILSPNAHLGTYHYFANTLFNQLKSSETIAIIKRQIPGYSTVGYYSDLPYGYEYMMYCVLQNLLAPILIDRDHAKDHRNIIMFLNNKDKNHAFNKTSVQYLGHNLFLTNE